MTFATFFKLSSYCLIGSGFAALAATGEMDGATIGLFSLVFVCSWWIDTADIRRKIPPWVLNAVAMAYLPFCVADYLLLSGSLLMALLHLLIFASAIKLLTLSRDQDYVFLYLISLTELIAASTLTVSILYAACFILFLLSGISALILFEMRRTNARMQKESFIQPLVVSRQMRGTGLELFAPFPSGLLSAMVLGITLLILVVLVPVFFLLPRVTSGLYRHPFGEKRYTSGFSEQVELGQIGRIKQSGAVVMRVKTDKQLSELPADLKWRGLAFDCYDGRSWKRSSRNRRSIPVQGRFYKLEDSTQGTNLLEQTFFLEALSTDVLFAKHKALAVSTDAGSLLRDDAEGLYAARHADSKLRYSVVSDPIRPDPTNISDLRPIPPDIMATYTQVPPMDPRIMRLAQQVTRSAKDNYAKAQALELYLRTNYAYSLVLRGTPGSRDPLAVFLFDVRSGHCEYFASAMAIMLRQLRIPARLVNGFRRGEYNAVASSWTVRQYDAHSWVEAYFPPYGWIEFDPTPPDPQHSRNILARWISDLTDAVDLWWWEGVVNYDRPKQSRMIIGLGTGIEEAGNGLRTFAGTAKKKAQAVWAAVRSPNTLASVNRKWTLWFALAAAAGLIAFRPLRRGLLERLRRRLYRKDPRMIAVSFYSEALALLGARGLQRSRGQTPMEFAASLGDHPAASPFTSLTRMYYAVRFGPPGIPFHHAGAREQLRRLRDALKAYPS